MTKSPDRKSKKLFFAIPEDITDFTDEQIEEFAKNIIAQFRASREEQNDRN